MAPTVFLFVRIPRACSRSRTTGCWSGQRVPGRELPDHEGATDPGEREPRAGSGHRNRVSFIGGGPGGGGANTGSVFVTLKPRPPRKATDQIITRPRPKLAKLVYVNLYLQARQDVQVGGRLARTQYQYTLQDPELTELNTWAPQVFDRFAQLPELTDVATDQQSAGPAADLHRPGHRRAAWSERARHRQRPLRRVRPAADRTTYGVANQYRQVMEVTQPTENEDSLKNSTSAPSPRAGAALRPHVSRGNLPTSINHQVSSPR